MVEAVGWQEIGMKISPPVRVEVPFVLFVFLALQFRLLAKVCIDQLTSQGYVTKPTFFSSKLKDKLKY